ncbi:MAG: diacylglycerol kinase [Sphingomonadaceae bacterium]|nr:MAG: diacylglycerol kinase [Sphingomonadaceae bacterium]
MDARFILVVNARSGSFDEDTVETILATAGEHGLGPVAQLSIPDDACPCAQDLPDDAVLAIYAGDGTCNSVIAGLDGWDGSVLILPGGTMNLASKRMHGEAGWENILGRFARGEARTTRGPLIRTPHGNAVAGVMAGPGATWNEVREAMRDRDLPGMARRAVEAFRATDDGANIVLDLAPLDRIEGYPMIEALADESGLEINAYHADDAGEFAIGLGALLLRHFRSGPHDSAITQESVRIRSVDGLPIGLLLDGEPVPASPEMELSLVASKVDLLTTRQDD